MKTAVYPYSVRSKSARAIAEGLGVPLLTRRGEDFGGRVINWGSSHVDAYYKEVLNPPGILSRASNKINFFRHMSKVATIPEYTTDPKYAAYLLREGFTIVARETVTGSGGKGIKMVPAGSSAIDLPYAPLYTVYVPKVSEFRLHFMKINGQTQLIHAQVKVPADDGRDVDEDSGVWNHDNGFVYKSRRPEVVPLDAVTQGRNAFDAIVLDFAALDVVIDKEGKAYVLEANTAPGCNRGSQTAGAYCAAFRQIID